RGPPRRYACGLHCAESAEFRCLGKAGDISKAQHCRAEVHLRGYGWGPVDPADVRKGGLGEDPAGPLPLTEPKVHAARARLFGAWEMNWLPYNHAHDVRLPGSGGKPVAFLMYPQCETGEQRRDCLDPATFRYTITPGELVGHRQTGAAPPVPHRAWMPANASAIRRPALGRAYIRSMYARNPGYSS